MSRRMKGESAALWRKIEALGWPIRETREGYLVYPPDGSRAIAFHSYAGGHPRMRHKIIARFRRAGADL